MVSLSLTARGTSPRCRSVVVSSHQGREHRQLSLFGVAGAVESAHFQGECLYTHSTSIYTYSSNDPAATIFIILCTTTAHQKCMPATYAPPPLLFACLGRGGHPSGSPVLAPSDLRVSISVDRAVPVAMCPYTLYNNHTANIYDAIW